MITRRITNILKIINREMGKLIYTLNLLNKDTRELT